MFNLLSSTAVHLFFIQKVRKKIQKNKLYVHKLGDLVSKKSSAIKKTDLTWDMPARLHLNPVFS